MITRFPQVLEKIREYPVKKLAVAAAGERAVLEAVRDARTEKIADSLLVGDQEKISSLAKELRLDLKDFQIVNEPDELKAAQIAAELVRSGKADILMKGLIHTDDFLRAVLDKDHGLRGNYVMSHVFLLEATHLNRILFVTDGGMNIAPDLVTKAQIILNAVYLARIFGINKPRVACLAAIELVNPRMSATLEAAALAKMSERGQFPDCIVDGPFALDNALSKTAAETKGIKSPVAGEADILLLPDIEAGNILAKSFTYLAEGMTAGVLVGATAPVVLTSRSDSGKAKLYSIAVAVLMSDLARGERLKIGKIHY